MILQRIREAERDMMFEEYRDRVGELITGIVQQSDSRYTLVQLRERVEALLPKSEQVDGERYDHSQRIKAVIKEVSSSTRGPSIIVSRRDPELIKSLFELEVPEIADGLVEITNVAREPGYRSKIAVVSHADGVDPVGACVGPRGSRVRMVVSELRGEKIDIIPYNDEPARFVAKALSPARVREVLVDDENKQATVIVPDDQLSLAIGREGQNARLAARLTGWRVDIRSETEFAKEETDSPYEEEEVGGRCAAILGNGRRCPNAALPSSRYCGLDSHQALENKDTDVVGVAWRVRTPIRRCAGCGARAPRERLHRFATVEGAVVPDPEATRPGTGRLASPDRRVLGGSRHPPRVPSRLPGARDHPRKNRRLHLHMAKKRVHELAKQYDMPSSEVMKRLQAYGLEVKAAATAVDTELADAALTGKPKPKASSNGAKKKSQPEPPAHTGVGFDRPAPRAPRPADNKEAAGEEAARTARARGNNAGAKRPTALLAAGRARPRLRRRRPPRRDRLAGRAPHGSRRRSRRPRWRPAAPPAAPRRSPAPRHLHGADAAGRQRR